LGGAFLGSTGYKFISVIISLYLFGNMAMRVIMAANMTSGAFVGIEVLESYYFWVSLFFVIGGPLSFSDIVSNKIF
jgi:hypothetical protein